MTRLKEFLTLIRFEHTVFALPHVYIGMMISPGLERVTPLLLLQVTMCAVFARTSAMILNRVIDMHIDILNPRTRYRHKLITRFGSKNLILIAGVSAILLIVIAYTINPILAYLAPIAVAVFFIYPYMKRFTSASHFILGFALSIAPVGGFLSTQVEGYGWNATTAMILLVIAILTWVSGFDIIYSLGDVGFDRKSHLYSIPARWGVKRSLYLVSGLYALSVLFLYLVRFFTPVTGYAYLISCVIAGVLLAYQIRIAGNGEWKHAFDLNMWVSPLILLGLIIDVCIL